MELAERGASQSFSMSQLGRMLTVRMIAGDGWDFELGATRGALSELDTLCLENKLFCCRGRQLEERPLMQQSRS